MEVLVRPVPRRWCGSAGTTRRWEEAHRKDRAPPRTAPRAGPVRSARRGLLRAIMLAWRGGERHMRRVAATRNFLPGCEARRWRASASCACGRRCSRASSSNTTLSRCGPTSVRASSSNGSVRGRRALAEV